MPFARPTLTEIIDRVIADISSRIVGVESAVLRRSLLGILGRAEAGAVHLLYGYIDWVSSQVLPDTADYDYLVRWCRIWGVLPNAATFSTGQVTFTGTNGTTIPDGTIVQRQDGVQYATQGDVTITGGTATATVLAVVAGADGDMAAGAAVFLLQPIAGVQATATVAAGGIVDGEDADSEANKERLLNRLLKRIQNPPQGGSATDYEQWALAVPGVTRAWVYPLEMGAGTVTVRFVRDDDAGGIIPDAGEVNEVQEYIDLLRPVTAEVFVVAPVAVPLNMTIKLQPNNAQVQAAVAAELQDLITRDAVPGGTILISRLREAVSIAAGEENNQIVTPTADVTHTTGQMAVLGTITWQSF